MWQGLKLGLLGFGLIWVHDGVLSYGSGGQGSSHDRAKSFCDLKTPFVNPAVIRHPVPGRFDGVKVILCLSRHRQEINGREQKSSSGHANAITDAYFRERQ